MVKNYHETVMADQAVNGLHIEKSRYYIDATLGTGGHTIAILEAGGQVLGIDMDPVMVEVAKERIKKNERFAGRYKLARGNFIYIDTIAAENGFSSVSGILFDLGVSNIHLKDLERGFSFENPGAELDMRIDPETEALKANDLLNVLRRDQLQRMFEVSLDFGAAKWLAGKVVQAREVKKFDKVGDMLDVCRGLNSGKKGLHEATLPFLALRIAVNSELENLKMALSKAFELLAPGGRLVVISFHSKEDGIVKNFFREKIEARVATDIGFKPSTAAEEERIANKKARSAKMRIIQKNE